MAERGEVPKSAPFGSDAVRISGAGVANGARTALPLAVAALIFGAALGVLAAAKGLTALELGLMSALVFAGASQVVAVELWGPSLAVLTIVLATAAINSRHMLMGATLAPWLGALPTPLALGCCFVLVDETWALSVARIRAGDRDAGFLVGAGLTFYLCWLTGTSLGHAFGEQVPDPARFGLDFLGVAVFLGLLTLFAPGRRDVLPFVLTIALTLLAGHFLPGKWNVLLGATAGALLAAGRGPSTRTAAPS